MKLPATIQPTLYAGQYFVVVQHPMQNNQFDIDADGPLTSKQRSSHRMGYQRHTCRSDAPDTPHLQDSTEAAACRDPMQPRHLFRQSTTRTSMIPTPSSSSWLKNAVINIVPIGDKHVGDKFTIKALTNLAVDDEILVQVYSSSFKPTQKSQSGEFSGATGTVKVTKGDSGMNTISFDVDASTFKPDEYIVTEERRYPGNHGICIVQRS